MIRSQQSKAVCSALGLTFALVLATTGCEQIVMLGSECQNGSGCTEGDADATQPEATQRTDDAVFAPPLGADSPPTLDPSLMDATIEAQLSLRNTSFTPDGGSVLNEFTFVELLQKIPLVDLVVKGVPDWASCKTLTVYYNLDTFPDAGAPLNDGIFLSFVPTGSVRQRLDTPMRAGANYFFKMNVLSQPHDGGVLKAQVLGAAAKEACDVEPVLLGESEPLPDYLWQQVCIRVTPRVDYNVVAFGASQQAVANGPGYLRLDNVVQMPSCSGNWRDSPRDASVPETSTATVALDGG